MGTVMADDTLIEISAGGQVSLNPVIRLWPDGRPSSLLDVGSEITFPSPAIFGPETDMLRNVSDPSLTVFAPDPAKANGVGVIVCPGGAWRVLAWEHEGITPARWLAARGYTALLLKYRVRGSPSDPAEFAAQVSKMAASMPTAIPDGGARPPNRRAHSIKATSRPTSGFTESAHEQSRVALEDGRGQEAPSGAGHRFSTPLPMSTDGGRANPRCFGRCRRRKSGKGFRQRSRGGASLLHSLMCGMGDS